MRLELRKLINI